MSLKALNSTSSSVHYASSSYLESRSSSTLTKIYFSTFYLMMAKCSARCSRSMPPISFCRQWMLGFLQPLSSSFFLSTNSQPRNPLRRWCQASRIWPADDYTQQQQLICSLIRTVAATIHAIENLHVSIKGLVYSWQQHPEDQGCVLAFVLHIMNADIKGKSLIRRIFEGLLLTILLWSQ
jgi:hypothetical protein